MSIYFIIKKSNKAKTKSRKEKFKLKEKQKPFFSFPYVHFYTIIYCTFDLSVPYSVTELNSLKWLVSVLVEVFSVLIKICGSFAQAYSLEIIFGTELKLYRIFVWTLIS